jgi:hybrid cluster-associated redox disulfide protein
MSEQLDGLSLETIMTRWPATIRVFIDWRLHCVGCPIADLHFIADSALEHGYEAEALERALGVAIATGISPAAPPRSRRRSAAGDAGP